MLDGIASYWSRLNDTVHPEDRTVFERYRGHAFNLDFPPPAFVGDMDRAPIVILQNNGGYDPSATPDEFPDAERHIAYRERLSRSAPVDADDPTVLPYYRARNFFTWLMRGDAAMLNAVAYRSPSSSERSVGALARRLPSAAHHREWLTEILWPQVQAGQRCLIVHRRGLWGKSLDRFRDLPNAIWSGNPRMANLTERGLRFGADVLDRPSFPALRSALPRL